MPIHDPVRVAERLATLDLFSAGRVLWGVGRGVTLTELEGFGVAPADSRDIFRRRFAELRQMLRTGEFTRDGRANIAFDAAMIEAHKASEIPDTIRFLRFPPTALVGRHQALSEELRLDHCRKNGIGVVRRITGGGAIYFDEGQLGWELVFGRSTLGIANLAELTKAICEAAALGLRTLGVAANHLLLFVGGKMQVASLGDFWRSSKPLHANVS